VDAKGAVVEVSPVVPAVRAAAVVVASVRKAAAVVVFAAGAILVNTVCVHPGTRLEARCRSWLFYCGHPLMEADL
jgi:hypothetical protein